MNKKIKLRLEKYFSKDHNKEVEKNACKLDRDQPGNLLTTLTTLRSDLSRKYIISILINEEKYLDFYDDIRLANISAIDHYFTYGYKESRELFEPDFKNIPNTEKLKNGESVFYLEAPRSNAIFKYRITFKEKNNKKSILLDQENSIIEILLAIFKAKEITFIRPKHQDKKINYLINICKKLNVKVIIDYDDLLLPEFTHLIGAVRSGISNFDDTHNELIKDSSILLSADGITCSTQVIADSLSNIVDDISICKNKLPKEYFISRERVLAKKIEDKIKVLYLSGSNTHFKDYSLISGPLIKLSQQHPNLFSLTLLGAVSDQKHIFSHFGLECNVIRLKEFEEMLNIIREHDIVLVPLENNKFNDAKSNIKFIESASQGVAVIASSVKEYSECINTYENGWLCSTEEEWLNTLLHLFCNPNEILTTSLAAYDSALKGYSI
ncbi:glycosyltransferase [Pantoea sp. SM3]|uniref:glycosyltransferase n=1 Tax=Pantoea sp. SM3 TaxID=1628192 RepID=UPI0005F88AFE|nr:glycosyltransferase [Pantoea sp. SM3]KJV31157.1 hypothetical protein VI01_11705 [Pantoea sp. SM3]